MEMVGDYDGNDVQCLVESKKSKREPNQTQIKAKMRKLNM